MTIDQIINYLQFGVNTFMLAIAGWLYTAYIKNLNATVELKNEQLLVAEKTTDFYKAKSDELLRKSPENIEKILNDRIRVREEELRRLHAEVENLRVNRVNDKNSDGNEKEVEHLRKELENKEQEVAYLRSEVEKAKNIKREISNFGDDLFSSGVKHENEELGFIAVDSGSLMITDPGNIDSEWQRRDFDDIRLYKDLQTSKIYQYRKDFKSYQEKIAGLNKTVNELVEEGRFQKVTNTSTKIDFSYAGAMLAALSEKGYGAMPFKLGHEGAGITVRTVFGDGLYPVYGEKQEGKIVRLYIDLI